jgi:hypothetical protein
MGMSLPLRKIIFLVPASLHSGAKVLRSRDEFIKTASNRSFFKKDHTANSFAGFRKDKLLILDDLVFKPLS